MLIMQIIKQRVNYEINHTILIHTDTTKMLSPILNQLTMAFYVFQVVITTCPRYMSLLHVHLYPSVSSSPQNCIPNGWCSQTHNFALLYKCMFFLLHNIFSQWSLDMGMNRIISVSFDKENVNLQIPMGNHHMTVKGSVHQLFLIGINRLTNLQNGI